MLQELRDYIEAGTVVFINYCDHYGKVIVILDIVHAQRVSVNGLKKFPRAIYPLKRLKLNRLKLSKVLSGARTGTVAATGKEFNHEVA